MNLAKTNILHLPLLFAALATGAPVNAEDLKITILGSSTVWGTGLLDEMSLIGRLDERLRDDLSDSVSPDAMSFSTRPQKVKNRKFFRGEAAKLSGSGQSVEFDLYGNTLALWQVIARTTDYGVIGVYADGKRIGEFDNRNRTLGSSALAFSGDGNTRMFSLKRPFTYGHKISVNGEFKRFAFYDQDYVSGDIARYYKEYDGVVIRAAPLGKRVNHYLYFFHPPESGAQISARFQYGETICYTASSVGGTDEENRLESTYGPGDVSFDPTKPSEFSCGLDFRYSNPKALFLHRFESSAKRRIKLMIEKGENPYLIINFASNKAHLIQNAGIGGFTAERFLKDRFGRSVKDSLKIFVPDVAYIVLGGNDDWKETERLVEHRVANLTEKQVKSLHSLHWKEIRKEPSGNYSAIRKAGIIHSVTPFSLRSAELVGSGVKAGNFVRIGNYYGDNRSTAVRIIDRADPVKGEIFWSQPLKAETMIGIERIDDLIGAEYTIRTLKTYSTAIAEMIRVLRQANPEMKIILMNTYTPNYFMREVWGYAEALTVLASQFKDCVSIDATPAVEAWSKEQISGKSQISLISTGAKTYELPWRKHWQGFKVLVDGVDVYGRDCRIESGWFYAPEQLQNKTWKCGRTKKLTAIPMKLVFTKKIPENGKKIEVIRADKVWSGDFAHPEKDGCRVIGDVAFDALNTVIGKRKQ